MMTRPSLASWRDVSTKLPHVTHIRSRCLIHRRLKGIAEIVKVIYGSSSLRNIIPIQFTIHLLFRSGILKKEKIN